MIKSSPSITLITHKWLKILVPLSWNLLQIVQTLSKPTHTIFLSFNKTPGCFMKISSSKLPWRKVIFTSICSTSKSRVIGKLRTILMDDIFTTGEKISFKSTIFFRPKPFTTNLALYLGDVELAFYFNGIIINKSNKVKCTTKRLYLQWETNTKMDQFKQLWLSLGTMLLKGYFGLFTSHAMRKFLPLCTLQSQKHILFS